MIISLVNKYNVLDKFMESDVRKIWLSQFFKFKKFKEQSLNTCKSNLISLIVNHLKSKQISLNFLVSRNINFFTSDNPIFHVEYRDNMEIYFPITKDICLVIIPRKRKYENLYEYYEINSEKVKEINDKIIENSKRNFICTSDNFKDNCNKLIN